MILEILTHVRIVLVDVTLFSASLGLSLAATLVKPHQLALFIAGPLVTALAVLWSVVRLYDLLKSSALASGTVCQKAKPLEYKLNEGDGPSAGRLPQAVWPHVQHVEQRDRGCVVTREYCNDIQNRRSNL